MSPTDRAGRLPIHYAAVDDKPEELRQLIQSGQDVNVQDVQGWTPLHFAAYWGKIDIIRILLKNGADVASTNHAGYTPLDLAASSTKDNVIEGAKLIFQHGGNPHHKDTLGGDTISYLESLNPDSPKKELLKFFREHGVE